MGRAIGETMAVLMVVGNAPVIPESISSPVSTLTSQIGDHGRVADDHEDGHGLADGAAHAEQMCIRDSGRCDAPCRSCAED